VSSLDDSLRRILTVEGVQAAALIDVATGMIVRSAGAEHPNLPAAAASMADEIRAARAAPGPEQPGGELDGIVLFAKARMHLTTILRSRPGEGLLLFIDLDLSEANMALASMRVGKMSHEVLA
jgi:hypothetical protein